VKPFKTLPMRASDSSEPYFPYFLTIPLLLEIFKAFLRSCTFNAANRVPPGSGDVAEKPMRHAHTTIPGVIGDPGSCLHKTHDDPFDGPARVFAPQIEPMDQRSRLYARKPNFSRLHLPRTIGSTFEGVIMRENCPAYNFLSPAAIVPMYILY